MGYQLESDLIYHARYSLKVFGETKKLKHSQRQNDYTVSLTEIRYSYNSAGTDESIQNIFILGIAAKLIAININSQTRFTKTHSKTTLKKWEKYNSMY